MNSSYGPALRRFWWVLAVGAVFAAGVAFLMVYSFDGGKLVKREKPVYTAVARLFVTSGEAPFLRTSVPRYTEVPIGTTEAQTTTRPLTQVLDAPDTRTLVAATNVYPLLIESDDVARLREDLYGQLPGEVTAQAIFSGATATRYQPSEIPVIELFATADKPGDAISMASATSKTFRRWMSREQNRAGIDVKQRIVIQELEAPTEAVPTGGGGIGLPVLALLAILTAFGAGAIMLDRLYPKPPDEDEGASESDAAASEASDQESLRRHVGISETG
jgi:hypothetical protein